MTDFQFWDGSAEGHWGPYPYWHVDLPFDSRTLAPTELSIRTVRFLLASLASPEKPLELVVLGESLGGLELYPPNGQAEYWTPNSDGLSADVVRLDLPNSATVEDLIQAIQIQDSPQIQLSLDTAPCFEAPKGMRCVEGIKIRYLYVDTEPVSAETRNQCRRIRCVRDIRGSWAEAAQLCAHQGKRLPTLEEVRSAEPPPLWTETGTPNRSRRKNNCGDTYPCWFGTQKLLSNGQSVEVKSALGHPVYCVSDRHILNSGEPFMVASPLEEVLFEPPSDDEKQLAWGVQNDPIEDKGICGEDIRQHWRERVPTVAVQPKCRDPRPMPPMNPIDGLAPLSKSRQWLCGETQIKAMISWLLSGLLGAGLLIMIPMYRLHKMIPWSWLQKHRNNW